MSAQLKPEDTFVRVSKYGHVFGEVKEITSTLVYSSKLGCSYHLAKVVSTNGVEYELAECHKVIKKYTPEQIERLKELESKQTDPSESVASLRNHFQINREIKKL